MKAELEAFVLREARLLDERRFADWLALFADDGVYWVPTLPGQATPQEALSLFYEPKPLLAMRVARLERPDMHAQAPASRTVHHVSGIEVSGMEARSALVVAEWRQGEARWFAARVTHKLRKEADGLRIVLKRVDLIDSEAPQRAIAVPF
ncbi:MAG TPA: aromatic-ring-hydroxylating dioxygenase subunit beta [Burkholderiales bacterium]|mgnify:CR=1 FL=1|jgi:benzoate/toluate 1,2-dioxygenase beta subunit